VNHHAICHQSPCIIFPIFHPHDSCDVHSVKLFVLQLLLHVNNIMSVCTSRVLVLALTCAALNRIIKLFCRTKRKHDSPNHLAGCLSLPREVLTKLEPCHILTCFSNDESEALTAIITDMANALNETFKKEEGILITNGWKPDIAAMQRYDAYMVRKVVSSFCQRTYLPTGKQRTAFCALPDVKTCACGFIKSQLFQQNIILIDDTENSSLCKIFLEWTC